MAARETSELYSPQSRKSTKNRKASESGCRTEGTLETQLSTTLTTPRLTSPRELQFSLRPTARPRLPSPISVTARSTGSKVTNFTTRRRRRRRRRNCVTSKF
ncbi:hypothetical protein ElyMa_001008900 [Elysia marginata]|uniref:Uncharacterized protein n=1 Tax=Elysia marginata TaxID=1093978 RepID=A0AAV4HJJ6_9GAST|nr:hypothetical protein ElyMa_001008900 [Elysia marginata]